MGRIVKAWDDEREMVLNMWEKENKTKQKNEMREEKKRRRERGGRKME